MQTLDHAVYAAMINDMTSYIHGKNVEAGWWTDKSLPAELQDLTKDTAVTKYVVGTKMALTTSELSEALEAYRKDLMDDHLPHRKGVEVELADKIIRAFDLAGRLNLDLGGAIIEKLAYNARRPDHKPENRELPGGKSI